MLNASTSELSLFIPTESKSSLEPIHENIPPFKLILDNRETYLIDKLKKHNVNIEVVQLPLGDIIIGNCIDNPLVIIERKSFTDLFASIKDGRYNEQSFRLQQSCNIHSHNIIYLLEGKVTDLNETKQKLLYSCITSIQLFKGFSIIRTSTLDETVNFLLAMINKIERDFLSGKQLYFQSPNKTSNQTDENGEIKNEKSYLSVGINKMKSKNIKRENIGAIMLSQIPGINYIIAELIMKSYNGEFTLFYDDLKKSNGTILDNLKNENGRKISKTAISNIKTFIL
jgi:ERCC4-type nuclease